MTKARTWLITGAGQGLGQALAAQALARGHRVAVTARSRDAAQQLAGEYPDTAIALALDVTDQGQVQAAVAAAEARFGGIDVLVNNAGCGFIGAIEEADPPEYRALFDTNLFGLIEMIRATLPGMRRRVTGHIINVSSSGGLAASGGHGIYCASKFAVEGISEALAAEVAPLGIGVTIIEPGSFRTNFRAGSLRSAARIIDAYAHSSGAQRVEVPQGHGKQLGDPRRAGAAIVDMVERGWMPLRLMLGSDCIARADRKLAMLAASRDECREIACATDFSAMVP